MLDSSHEIAISVLVLPLEYIFVPQGNNIYHQQQYFTWVLLFTTSRHGESENDRVAKEERV